MPAAFLASVARRLSVLKNVPSELPEPCEPSLLTPHWKIPRLAIGSVPGLWEP